MTAPSTLLRRPDRLYDGYVFDLDGTVYLGDALLPGAAEVVARIRARGRRTVFLSNNPTRDIVVASYDRTFDYRKLQIAFDTLWQHRRARLITSNPDRYCPMPGGRGEPDAAAVVAAIEACADVTCEANLGKPGTEMLEAVTGMLSLSPSRCVLIGDRLSTDIAMAAAAGMDSALVLTGETTPSVAARLPADGAPTWILDRIDHLLPPSEGDVDG